MKDCANDICVEMIRRFSCTEGVREHVNKLISAEISMRLFDIFNDISTCVCHIIVFEETTT